MVERGFRNPFNQLLFSFSVPSVLEKKILFYSRQHQCGTVMYVVTTATTAQRRPINRGKTDVFVWPLWTSIQRIYVYPFTFVYIPVTCTLYKHYRSEQIYTHTHGYGKAVCCVCVNIELLFASRMFYVCAFVRKYMSATWLEKVEPFLTGSKLFFFIVFACVRLT